MEQAAGIVGGEGADAVRTDVPGSRPVLSLAGRVGDEDLGRETDVEVSQSPTPVASVREDVGPADGSGSSDGVTVAVDAASRTAAAGSPRPPEEAEHEAVAIARAAKDSTETTAEPISSTGVDGADPVDAVDPVAAAIAAAAAGVDPAEPTAGVVSTRVIASPPESADEPKREMDYHEALSHINRTSARREHVDIDDRITEYVRTNRRDALDKPSRITIRRERKAERSGMVDERLVEARRIVQGGISSKDIAVQVMIDRAEARKGGKGADQIRSLTKGPAAAMDPDPSVVAAASRARAAPGL